jgi:antitoxin StbD
VPAEAIGETEHRPATLDEVMESLTRRREINQPVLDYLKDK